MKLLAIDFHDMRACSFCLGGGYVTVWHSMVGVAGGMHHHSHMTSHDKART
jgi:hypothetical protein